VKSRIPREDFIGDSNADSYAIAIDPSGKLKWQLNAIDPEHVITILSERVSDDYLAFLQPKRVSYLFGGKTNIDLHKVLRKLSGEFGIRTLLLEGGAKSTDRFSHRGREIGNSETVRRGVGSWTAAQIPSDLRRGAER
jgi:2,5-diamino-6-(ribosylamino)-4(3H)-pyrimidinone 5'-phosphate reductase